MKIDEEEAEMIAEKVIELVEESRTEEEELGREIGITDPNYEFKPVPTQVLYDSRERALKRAEKIGLDGVHTHILANNHVTYMPGDTHGDWIDFVEGKKGKNVRPRDSTPIRRENSEETVREVKDVFESQEMEDVEIEEDEDAVRTEPSTIHEITDSEGDQKGSEEE